MLQSLGVSAAAEAIYVILAKRPTAGLQELKEAAAESHLAASEQVESALEELVQLGLAAHSAPREWQALALVDGARRLKELREAELKAAISAAESLQGRILAASRANTGDNISVLIGGDAILEARANMCDGALKEICAFDKPPHVQSRPGASSENLSQTSPEWRALERGLSLRCVYHPGFDADRLAELALFFEKGEQSRTAPVPMKLMIADAEVALIPSMKSYEPGQDLRASLVRHPQLVEALVWLFESVFHQSVPIITSAGYSGRDPRRQMLISLLMAGSTDGAIATQLGINIRSVRRWIAELMDELGVSNRLQLGAALVRSAAHRSRVMPK